MTLLLALFGGFVAGYLLGWSSRTVLLWLALWAVVLPLQTRFLVAAENVADWSYLPVQGAIVALALVLIRLGAAVRARSGRPAAG